MGKTKPQNLVSHAHQKVCGVHKSIPWDTFWWAQDTCILDLHEILSGAHKILFGLCPLGALYCSKHRQLWSLLRGWRHGIGWKVRRRRLVTAPLLKSEVSLRKMQIWNGKRAFLNKSACNETLGLHRKQIWLLSLIKLTHATPRTETHK